MLRDIKIKLEKSFMQEQDPSQGRLEDEGKN